MINWAGFVAITPGGESTICIAHRMARLVRLCDTPRVGIPVNSGAPGPNDSLEDEGEFAFGIRFRSRCSGAGGGGGRRWWRWPWNWASKGCLHFQNVMLFLKNFQCILKDKKLILSQTLINRAGRMTIAPVGKSIIYIAYRIASLVRLCYAPRIPRNITKSCAASPSDERENKRETTLGNRVRSRYSVTGGVGGRCCWWWNV